MIHVAIRPTVHCRLLHHALALDAPEPAGLGLDDFRRLPVVHLGVAALVAAFGFLEVSSEGHVIYRLRVSHERRATAGICPLPMAASLSTR